jgi:hypothetical protein
MRGRLCGSAVWWPPLSLCEVASGSNMSTRVQPKRSSRSAYPQDDDPLCCCEYRNRRGERAHVFGLFCACEEVDELGNDLLTGKWPGQDQIDEVISDIDDRLRLPLPGGAWHVGLPASVPWALLPVLLLIGATSARCLLIVSCAVVPLLLWWHRRSLRLRRRSGFLLSWMLCSLAFESLVYTLALRHRHSTLANAGFGVPLCLCLSLFAMIKRTDATRCTAAVDSAGANGRSVQCAVCLVTVPRYDHYCAWVDEPVGAENHRAYLGFVTSMLLTCWVGSSQFLAAAHARGVSWHGVWALNQSSLLLSCACYGFLVGCAVFALLVHQLALIASGQTAYEARRRGREGGPHTGGNVDAAVPKAGIHEGSQTEAPAPWRAFLRQTTPLRAMLAVALMTGPRAGCAAEHESPGGGLETKQR